ncbi:DUF294 nucleotidyltransferase-like domain-containing protein [Cohnella thailandensis]|uniref:CBS domain-containing protein n=1 Tax=Cohnella thailandensis TaxID=557557 RepID=A0A841SPX0_9BACL|nr:DUF294 nucleotidyltransferase-like domain-containing protein [Cohnella thailandensis]MBB6634004.1 hypothetical protein [Cohnella thailandensis]MBP1972689.1 CBS domain-containing protein [Cohnella thailandensis]
MSSLHKEKRLLDITGAGDPGSLRTIREEEQNRLGAILSSSPVIELVEDLNELHDSLILRALKLAEIEMARLGHGAPPVPYAYLLFGSGGRREQTFSSDQDSSLIYLDPQNEADALTFENYFQTLAQITVGYLVDIGYPPCEGNVIASNPDWCMSISAWERKLDSWFEEPNWENVRYLLIVADGRLVGGDEDLGARWNARFYRDFLGSPVIARRMMENTLRHKVLVGVFGQLLTERYGELAGTLDIKYGAYIPMVNVFRLMAVHAGIKETSTIGRIRELEKAEILSSEEAKEAAEAFELFLLLRLMAVTKDENGQWAGTGVIHASKLKGEWKVPLKKALKLGRKLQRQVEREMRYRFGGR